MDYLTSRIANCKKCALTREKFLKSGQGRKLLDRMGQ